MTATPTANPPPSAGNSLLAGWSSGLTLISLGAFFLFRDFAPPHPRNWWALLLVALGAQGFVSAWRFHRGARAELAARSLLRATTLSLLGCVLFLDLEWAQIWPIILIFGGVFAILSGYRRVV